MRSTFAPPQFALKMMHHRTNAIDADLRVLGFAIPQPPAQPLRLSSTITAFAATRAASSAGGPTGCLLEVVGAAWPMWNQSGDRQLGDAGIGENAPQSGAPVGVKAVSTVSLVSSDGVEALADQDF